LSARPNRTQSDDASEAGRHTSHLPAHANPGPDHRDRPRQREWAGLL